MYYIIGLCFRYRVIPLSSPLCLNALNSTPTMIITLYMSSSLRLFRMIQRMARESHTVASSTSIQNYWLWAEMRLSDSYMALQNRFKQCSTSHVPHAALQRNLVVMAQHTQGTAVG